MYHTKTVMLEALSKKGRALDTEKKFEVIGGLPNEKVVIAVGPRRKKARLGFLQEVIIPSSERILPRCLHASLCGGCSFQHLDYLAQLRYKEEEIKKEFQTLLKEHKAIILPIIGCFDPWQYRNKMEFSFSENQKGEKFLGLIIAGTSKKVINIQECFLVSPWFSKTLQAIKLWWEKTSLHAYRHATNTGHLRTVTLREAKQGNGKLVMLTISGNPAFAIKKSQIKAFIQTIQEVCGKEFVSIFLQIQQIAKGKKTEFFEMLLHGSDHITERLYITCKDAVHILDFKMSPTSFFQPNTKQAQRMVSLGLGMFSSLKEKKVLDLYCGGAMFGLSAAKIAKEVVGIECNPYAVFDAKWSQEANYIKNFSIYQGDVGEILQQLKETFLPDMVIVDPPRIGLDKKSLSSICKLAPKEILYVSCNPSSQVADIKAFVEEGYVLKLLQPIDQFPHTPHIENIALLQKS